MFLIFAPSNPAYISLWRLGQTGLTLLDVDFLIRFAHEEARRKICASMNDAQSLASDSSPKLPQNFGLHVSFTGAHEGGLFEVHEDDLATNTCTLPFYPSQRNQREVFSEGGNADEEDVVKTVLKIKYALGFAEQTMQVLTTISRAACEGRECSCCRFHAGDGAGKGCEPLEGKVCSVHPVT